MGENENVALKQVQKEAQESSQNLISKKSKEVYDREYSNNSSLTKDIKEVQKEELPFHPCLTPRGMTWFNLEILTPVQQKLLNDLKVEVIKEDNQYLAKHPEIRAIIAVFLHAILKEQPKLQSVVDFARDFFINMKDVKEKVDEYMKERNEPIIREGVSAMNVEIPIAVTRTSLDEFDVFSRADVYTYSSFTTPELSTPIEYEESEYDLDHLYRTTSTTTARSRLKSVMKARQHNIDDLLFSSQISLISDHEGFYEDQLLEFDEHYALPASPHPTEIDVDVPIQKGSSQVLTEDQEFLDTIIYGEDYDDTFKQDYDYDDVKVLKEIKIAQEIHESLSVVIDVYEDDEDEKDENYIFPEDKKSIIQADIESLKDGTMIFDENEDQFEIQKKASVVLETLLNYETKKTLSVDGEG